MQIWIVGAGGLLGSALVRKLSPSDRSFLSGSIPWGSPEESSLFLRAELERFHAWRDPGDLWGIVWAAGAGVISSSVERFESEHSVLMSFAAGLADAGAAGGVFLFASSASVFGSGSEDFDEDSNPAPISEYGRFKLSQEHALATVLGSSVPLVVARISTLYGPGQNLNKGQGLISTMLSEILHRRSISLYVPLETTRDYLYVADAAERCLFLLRRAAERGGAPGVEMRVVASQRGTTLGELAHLVQAVAHRRVHALQVHSPLSSLHARHLTLTSTDPELARLRVTPLPVGLHAVYQRLLADYMAMHTRA